MLSQTVEHALRATLHIARRHPHAVRVEEAAQAAAAPRNYLSKILGQLARAGVLESTRGPTGGFRLRTPAHQITLANIVAIFEAAEQRRCLLGHGICGKNPSCTAHLRWAPIAAAMDGFLSHTTLADLLSPDAASPLLQHWAELTPAAPPFA